METLPGAGHAVDYAPQAQGTHGAIAGDSNHYKTSQQTKKGFRPIAINAVTGVGDTLQPDRVCEVPRRPGRSAFAAVLSD
jgi:hypothetical protein